MADQQHVEFTSPDSDLRQLHTNDLELGATEAAQQHISRHVVASKPVSQRKLDFEHSRPRWLREMAAEATGTYRCLAASGLTGAVGRYRYADSRSKAYFSTSFRA